MKTTYCDKCCKEYRNCNFKKHRCEKKVIKFIIKDEWEIGNNEFRCPECGLTFSKFGMISHYYRKHDERGIDFLVERKVNSKKYNKIKKTKEEISLSLSKAMKKCHSDGKHPGWSHINSDKERRSYPEKFFIQVFKNEGLYEKYTIEEKFSYGKYFLDFLFVELMLVVEIDGSQHYRTKDAVEHDQMRDRFLLDNGFKVYRIKWADVNENPSKEIKDFIHFLTNKEAENIRVYEIKKTEKKICQCGNEIKTKKSKICDICRSFNNRVVKDRPEYDILLSEIEKIGYSATGRKYGVSDNAVRKWIKYYKKEK